MKTQTSKNLIDAHGWLGVIISGVLMIVFACGTASFFRDNIVNWDKHYNPEKVIEKDELNIAGVVQYVQDNYSNIPNDHSVFISMPKDTFPYYRIHLEVEKEVDESELGKNKHAEVVNGRTIIHEQVNEYLDPYTLSPIDENADNHYLGHMFYKLHINLKLGAIGAYIVGFVSLFFFVILISGVLIHFKRIVSRFYMYRLNKSRSTYLDGHNLIGITTLPYTVMYALTGILFNLGIIFQAGFGYAVFNGDIEELTHTAGFSENIDVDFTGKPMLAEKVTRVQELAEERYPDYQAAHFNIHGFNDQGAIVSVILDDRHQFLSRARVNYHLEDASIYSEATPTSNEFMSTYNTLEALHFGWFGGITGQVIFFILGLGCCYLILSGNLIWLETREKKRKQSQLSLRFVKAMTLALSSGVLIAIALSFVATRLMPDQFARIDILPYVFHGSWIAAMLHGFIVNRARLVMVYQLGLATVLFLVCPIYDAALYLQGDFPEHAYLKDVAIVNISLLLFALFCGLMVASKRGESAVKETSFVTE
ncbi:PepSY domain-containing protein [Bermanella marisrubri]|nr:PepSY-associated TM helix domain-containing protein [Bermanella marisrubri]QIZ83988.1 PepSY domain-containing protein [Bermanella marisrubri]